jgi:hypothetical protein
MTHTEVTYDDTAAVYEAWIVDDDTGERQWIGCADTFRDGQKLVAAAFAEMNA